MVKTGKILITGASGNIGVEVIRYLLSNGWPNHQLVAGVRETENAISIKGNYPKVPLVAFDFTNPSTFQSALNGAKTVFLLRPPQIADVDVFKPLFEAMIAAKIKQVVFLSVQGVEESSIIPHHKIEKLIIEKGFDYVFVRPGYFMQNLTTTLYPEIKAKRTITLPAGDAPFNWVDASNVGEVVAMVLMRFNHYRNQAIEVTGAEQLSFKQVVAILNNTLSANVVYRPVNPIAFYLAKRKEGIPTAFIMVMIMLHFVPRFQQPPALSDTYKAITEKKPTSLQAFFERERDLFEVQ